MQVRCLFLRNATAQHIQVVCLKRSFEEEKVVVVVVGGGGGGGGGSFLRCTMRQV